jgi:hypothetical protein
VDTFWCGSCKRELPYSQSVEVPVAGGMLEAWCIECSDAEQGETISFEEVFKIMTRPDYGVTRPKFGKLPKGGRQSRPKRR